MHFESKRCPWFRQLFSLIHLRHVATIRHDAISIISVIISITKE